jgi:transcriptional regulator with XRE-family HTH domain
MSQTSQLISALKRLLKARGITYKQIGEHLHLSEISVKRKFSKQSFNIQTIEAICNLMQIEFSDLVKAAEEVETVSQLTEKQEEDLVSDVKSVLIATCVLNYWTFQRIITTYNISEAECISKLLRLERIGMIQLLPENRVKLKISRDFSWLPGGPIQQFFRERAQTDFLDTNFNKPGEVLRFQHAMISPSANLRSQQRLQRLVQEFTEQQDDSVTTPVDSLFGTSLLIAMRPWEPEAFQLLRCEPDKRIFVKNEV